MANSTYPVLVQGHLDSGLNRWLWLVKWLLAIPHYIILIVLYIAAFFVGLIAFFAILFTARYPRPLFDFNVGVLRWSWRVGYYTYSALGTDRYPPFSLADDPSYPARLIIDYPERLSRGLVLVKWWLLAIPHYIVITFFVGGGYQAAHTDYAGNYWAYGTGLITILVLFAAIVLLFVGRYPQAIFDLVLGMNRWVIRVSAYVGLMTDEYPPFRLDLGGDDPGSAHLTVPQAEPPTGAERGGPAPDEPAGTDPHGSEVPPT